MAEDKNLRVRIIKDEMKKLAPAVQRGDQDSIWRFAGFSAAAAGLEAGMGKFEEAGEDYRTASSTLENLRGEKYEKNKPLVRDYARLANEMDDLVAKRKKEIRSAYRTSGQYGAVATTAIVLLLIGGLALIAVPNITGYASGSAVDTNCNVFGMCMFVLGLIISYIYAAGKRKN